MKITTKVMGIVVSMIVVVLALYLSVFKYPASMFMRAGSMSMLLLAALILGGNKKSINKLLG